MVTNKEATDRTEPTTAAKRRLRKKRALEARREREAQLPSAHAQHQSTSDLTVLAAGKVAGNKKTTDMSPTTSQPKPSDEPAASLNEVKCKTSPGAEKKSSNKTVVNQKPTKNVSVTDKIAEKTSSGTAQIPTAHAQRQSVATIPAVGKVAGKKKGTDMSPTTPQPKPSDAPAASLSEVKCKTNPDTEKQSSNKTVVNQKPTKNVTVTDKIAEKTSTGTAQIPTAHAQRQSVSTIPAVGKVAGKKKATDMSPTTPQPKPSDAPAASLNEVKCKTSPVAENKSSNKVVFNQKPTKTVSVTNQIAEKTSAGTDEVDRIGVGYIESLEAEKSREQVKAEREAKKQAKLAKKKNATRLPDPSADSVQQVTHNIATVQEVDTRQAPAEETTKSKAEVRAERRAKQEAQRAAKTAPAAAAPVTPRQPLAEIMKVKTSKVLAEARVKTRVTPPLSSHRVNWFQHLYTERGSSPAHTHINTREVHPAVVRLAVQLASRVVAGANARCVALLHALKQVVSDYVLPARTEFSRGLETHLATALEFVFRARPASASMTNAVKHLRWHLTQLPNNISEFDAKHRINDAIDTYIRDQIEVAGEAISMAVRSKISHGDYILTYGSSSLVEKILVEAHECGLQFRVVVVGSRTRAHGRNMLRRLIARGVSADYAHISALSFLMRTADKVVVGAASLLGNGWVVAHAGTAQVALVARAFNVPVLVCCETHKFSERVQTDAFVCNELGDPEQLVEMEETSCPLAAWRSLAALTPLDLTYDVTPPGLVTAVVTELAVLPCTSAPVVLRFKLSEYGL